MRIRVGTLRFIHPTTTDVMTGSSRIPLRFIQATLAEIYASLLGKSDLEYAVFIRRKIFLNPFLIACGHHYL